MRIRALSFVLLQMTFMPAQAQPLQAGAIFRDCPACPEMVIVPPGEFAMGYGRLRGSGGGVPAAEAPKHAVTINYWVAVGRFEITRGQFTDFLKVSGYEASSARNCNSLNLGDMQWAADDGAKSWRNPGFEQSDEHPVVCVSWDDAKAYVNWLSRHTGKHYRLLSEAEWEYAARAGSDGLRPWGDNESDTCRHANVWDDAIRQKSMLPKASGRGIETFASKSAPRLRDQAMNPLDRSRSNNWYFETHSCHDEYAHTAPVGRYAPNRFGLHDAIGNVWEWVDDCANSTYEGAPTNGSAWHAGNCEMRVFRGASWATVPNDVRVVKRLFRSASFRSDDLGFRVARTP